MSLSTHGLVKCLCVTINDNRCSLVNFKDSNTKSESKMVSLHLKYWTYLISLLPATCCYQEAENCTCRCSVPTCSEPCSSLILTQPVPSLTHHHCISHQPFEIQNTLSQVEVIHSFHVMYLIRKILLLWAHVSIYCVSQATWRTLSSFQIRSVKH